MTKRERLLGLLETEGRWDYVPAGFFMHFPAEFHRGQPAVDKHVQFFRATGMDFVKIQFEHSFPVAEINGPDDWAKLPKYDLDFYAAPLEVVKGLIKELGDEALIVLTLYSPFMVTNNIGGRVRLLSDLDASPEAAMKGIEIMTNSLRLFVDACIDAGLDGFYHSTQGGESHRFAKPETFDRCVKPFDLALMQPINERCRFNILHVCDYHRDEFGDYPSYAEFRDYPGQIVNASLHTTKGDVTPKELADTFGRPFMGGIDRRGQLASGTEDDARQTARQALETAPDRFILAADCTVPGTTPWTNLRAAVDEAHRARS